MEGYAEENHLDSKWYTEILPYMKLREIDLYAVLIDTFGYEEVGHPWIDGFMNGRQAKIAENKPYVNFGIRARLKFNQHKRAQISSR